jgi:putative ABC transport system permease protein
MLKKITSSFLLAIHNIRSHFFHTLLSVLGIVIGVASLVAILSLIDGMEDYANKEITQTTSLKAIIIRSDAHKQMNGIRIRKDSFAILQPEHIDNLQVSRPASLYVRRSSVDEIIVGDSTIGTNVLATGVAIAPNAVVMAGSLFGTKDLHDKKQIVLINEIFAKQAWPTMDVHLLIGKALTVGNRTLIIQGVLANDKATTPYVVMPITLLTQEELRTITPELIIEAEKVEDVSTLKEEAVLFLKDTYPSYREDFSIFTNEMRVKQAAQGFLLFRVIMGLIVGISVLVGGIGIMNVLLISVTERTSEIGIRKAVGANRTDIMLQFLSESVTVSAFGSLLGLLVGILGTMVIVPIIHAITKVPFYAMYTWNTLAIISTVALVVGIVFGTYPAIRASRLDPVEAIRRE